MEGRGMAVSGLQQRRKDLTGRFHDYPFPYKWKCSGRSSYLKFSKKTVC